MPMYRGVPRTKRRTSAGPHNLVILPVSDLVQVDSSLTDRIRDPIEEAVSLGLVAVALMESPETGRASIAVPEAPDHALEACRNR